MMMFITKAHDDDVLLKLIEICSLLMVMMFITMMMMFADGAH